MSNTAPIQKAYIVAGGLPRIVTPDLAWVGGCSNSAGWPGRENQRPITHEPCAAFVILGSKKTLMLDTGHFGLWYSLEGQLEQVLNGRPLDYVFPSHQEIPHSGNLGRLLKKYPNAQAVGDVRDYQIFHPEIPLNRLVQKKHGETIDLGDREFVFLNAIWKDLSGTMWGYDTKLKLLFTADGFGHIHSLSDNVCGTMPHEMSPAQFKAISDRPALPFTGMRQRDQLKRVAAFENLAKKYPLEIIVSGHCGPIMGTALQPIIDKLMNAIGMTNVGPKYLQS